MAGMNWRSVRGSPTGRDSAPGSANCPAEGGHTVDQAEGKLLCVYSDTTVTRIVDDPSQYVTLDLTVWQR